MPALRPLVGRQLLRSLAPAQSTTPLLLSITTHSSKPAQGFSTSIQRSSDDAHGSHYDPPSGWLWGIPPGEKPKKEGWETIWVWGFWGSLGLTVVAYAYKPDTSIQTWALEEARRRLEAEGIIPDMSTAGNSTKPN